MPLPLPLPAGVALCALAACSSYSGSARDFAPARLRTEPGWIAVRPPPLVTQQQENECGLAAVSMMLGFWDRPVTLAALRAEVRPRPDRGVKAARLRRLVRARGLEAFLLNGQLSDLERELTRGRPVMVGLVKPYGRRTPLAHYEVVVALNRQQQILVTLDPAHGWRQNSFRGFLAEWDGARRLTLVVLPRPPPP